MDIMGQLNEWRMVMMCMAKEIFLSSDIYNSE